MERRTRASGPEGGLCQRSQTIGMYHRCVWARVTENPAQQALPEVCWGKRVPQQPWTGLGIGVEEPTVVLRGATGSHFWVRKSLMCKQLEAEKAFGGGHLKLILFSRPLEAFGRLQGQDIGPTRPMV